MKALLALIAPVAAWSSDASAQPATEPTPMASAPQAPPALPPAPPPAEPATQRPAPRPRRGEPVAAPIPPDVEGVPPGNGDEGGQPIAGWNGSFFVRDAKDRIRFYPRGRLHLDFNAFAGPGVGAVEAVDGGNALAARVFVRRLRLELGGEIFRRISFTMGADLSNRALSNPNGKTETAAARAGEDPTADTARFAPVQAVPTSVSIADGWINYGVCPCFNVMLGQYQAPFSMENRTSSNTHTWMERNVAIRGFAFPNSKEIGLTLWGELKGAAEVGYEVGVFGGDGPNRPQVDNRGDFIGRIWALPFARAKGLLDKAQLGVSAHHGDRDPAYVGYDYPAMTTGGGFSLWSPAYKDSRGRVVHVIPSGGQNEIGGELRIPIGRSELRGEAYYVANDTREAIDGFQLTNTERLGRMSGWAWYVQASVWPLGDAFANGDPGKTPRPTHVDLAKKPELRSGLEVFAIVAVVDATYEGGSRQEGAPDAKTPGNPAVGSDVNVASYGLGTTYWYAKNLRLSFNWLTYHTRESGTKGNLAVVPGNLGDNPDKSAHVLHEVGTRVGIMF